MPYPIGQAGKGRGQFDHACGPQHEVIAILRSGDLHITAFENPLMLNLAQGDDNITIEQQVTTNTYLMFVNSAHPELADPRVRQAISKGIDREQVLLTGNPRTDQLWREVDRIRLEATGRRYMPTPSPQRVGVA